jgi:hypothetical protein
MVDIDGWHPRDLIFNDHSDLHNLIRKRLSSLTLLAPSTHLLLRNMQADFLWLCGNMMEAFAPYFVPRYGVAASPVLQLMRRLSAMRRLSFLLLLMITLFKQQVSEMVPHTALRSSRVFMIILVPHRILNDPEVIIKIDISHAFNTTCRALTLDVLSGHASRDYACGLKV